MNTTFTTTSGTTFTANEKGTHFFAAWTENGKQIKKRISKKEYSLAKLGHELEVETRMHENLDKLCGDIEITEEDIERDARELERYLQEPDMESAIAETEESITTEEAKEIVERIGLGDDEHEGLHMDFTEEEERKVMEEADKWLEEHDKKTRVGFDANEEKEEKNPGNSEKKARKAAKKDVTFSMDLASGVLTLTAKQSDFLLRLSMMDVWDSRENGIYTEDICDQIGGQFKGKPMTVGAMISTLCEKGIAIRTKVKREKRTSTVMTFTDIGNTAIDELGLR